MIDQSKLNKAIKKENYIAIQREGSRFYITTEFLAVKLFQDITGGLETTLLKIFKTLPYDGEGFIYSHDTISKMTADQMKRVHGYLDMKSTEEVIDTGLIRISPTNNQSVYITGKQYVYVDKLYTDIIQTTSSGGIWSIGKYSPVIYVADRELAMIRPLRGIRDNQYLKEL